MLNTILSIIFLNSQYIFLFILPHNTFSKLIIYFCYSFILSYFFWMFMSIFGRAFKFTLSNVCNCYTANCRNNSIRSF